MKVFIDADKCQGHARCAQLAPEAFGLDNEGHGVVLSETVEESYESVVRNAVANCPERAIWIE
jgi:ferredoxin